MRNIRAITVVPNLPRRIGSLREIASNLWWTWTHDAQELFKRVDGECWETCRHNPVALLGRTSQERLKAIANDEGFLAHMDRVKANLDDYMAAKTWFQTDIGEGPHANIAYFSAEFGLHEIHEVRTFTGIGRTFGECDAAPFRALRIAAGARFLLETHDFEIRETVCRSQRIGASANNDDVFKFCGSRHRELMTIPYHVRRLAHNVPAIGANCRVRSG